MKRMERKQSGDKCAFPELACYFIQNKKQQKRVCNMKQEIYKMMRTGIHSEQLTVQHVRYPCQRMPVGGVKGGTRPNEVVRRQSFLNMKVISDIFSVIKKDEVKIFNIPESKKRATDKKKDNEYFKWIPIGRKEISKILIDI